MAPTRRALLAGTGALAAGVSAEAVAAAKSREPASERASLRIDGAALGVTPGKRDATAALQAAIDQASARGAILELSAGRYPTERLRLPPRAHIVGRAGETVLEHIGEGPLLVAEGGQHLAIEQLVVDGAGRPFADAGQGLIALTAVAEVHLSRIEVRASRANGITLTRCGGRILDCTVRDIAHAGIFSLDGNALTINGCMVSICGDNGILVWQSQSRPDGAVVTDNRIRDIRAVSGGTGQNGNGINVYRAGNVSVRGNHITDCAYSGVRGNAASAIQMVANQVARIGEVALYAEFAFEGAIISQNIVEEAAAGISVTNFNEGGRLAVVEGNLIRKLTRREYEPVDKRGEGISVEADTVVTGNVIEDAPTCGIHIGNGAYVRDVSATGNIVRRAGVGVAIGGDATAGAVLISNNILSDCKKGAIRQTAGDRPFGVDLIDTAGTGRIRVFANLAG